MWGGGSWETTPQVGEQARGLGGSDRLGQGVPSAVRPGSTRPIGPVGAAGARVSLGGAGPRGGSAKCHPIPTSRQGEASLPEDETDLLGSLPGPRVWRHPLGREGPCLLGPGSRGAEGQPGWRVGQAWV